MSTAVLLFVRIVLSLLLSGGMLKALPLTYTAMREKTVLIKPQTNIREIEIGDGTLRTWMTIQKGTFPNTSTIDEPMKIGEPLTIFIYLNDESDLFDLQVTDCWAYDDEIVEHSHNKVRLTAFGFNRRAAQRKMIKKWNKIKFPSDNRGVSTLLYANLSAFKFPERDSLHFVCDVELCFKSCDAIFKMKTRYGIDSDAQKAEKISLNQ